MNFIPNKYYQQLIVTSDIHKESNKRRINRTVAESCESSSYVVWILRLKWRESVSGAFCTVWKTFCVPPLRWAERLVGYKVSEVKFTCVCVNPCYPFM
jgi:hypothetical protein